MISGLSSEIMETKSNCTTTAPEQSKVSILDSIESVSDGELPSDDDDDDGQLSDIVSDESQDMLERVSSASAAGEEPSLEMGKSELSTRVPFNPPEPGSGSLSPGPVHAHDKENTEESSDDDDDDEDMEEQLLYLRLMALRSMAPELTENDLISASSPVSATSSQETDEKEDLIDEMAKLLEEADEAANATEDNASHAAHPTDFSEMLNKIRALKHNNDHSTLSSPGEVLQNGSSQKMTSEDDEVTILAEVKRKTPLGRIKVSDFARVSPAKPNAGHRQSSDMKFMDEPPNCDHVDMEIVCENEAEAQFFKDQIDPEKQKNAPFPPSVWEMLTTLGPPPPPPPPPPEEFPEGSPTRPPAGGPLLKRRRHASADDGLKRLRASEADDDDDPEQLRAMVLKSLEVKQKLKQQQQKQKQQQSTLQKKAIAKKVLQSAKTAAAAKMKSEISKLHDVSVQRKHFPNLFRPFVIPINVNEEAGLKSFSTGIVNSNSRTDFSSQLESFLRGVRQMSTTTTASTKKKVTPPPKPARKNPPGKSRLSTSTTAVTSAVTPTTTSITLPKPVRLLASKVPSGQPSTVATLKSATSMLSMDMKNSLMTSTVSHLSQAKQAEYKRLKELIAKKEQAKLLQKSGAAVARTVSVPAIKPLAVVDDEDPDALRKRLLESLAVRKNQNTSKLVSKKEVSPPPLDEAVGNLIPVLYHRQIIPTPTPNVQPSNVVVYDRKVVEAVEDVRPSSPPDSVQKQQLRIKEKALTESRREMIQELFKLSAQLSQLKGETKQLLSAEKFADDLRRQLAETEAVIKRRKERVVELKTTVKSSTSGIVSKRSSMLVVEEECRQHGTGIYGITYKPPTDGATEIKKKLAQIKVNADLLLGTSGNVSTADVVVPSSASKEPSPTPDKEVIISPAEVIPDKSSKSAETHQMEHHSSVLAHLSRPSNGETLNPHQPLCRYELLGKCNDDKCLFQHHTASTSATNPSKAQLTHLRDIV